MIDRLVFRNRFPDDVEPGDIVAGFENLRGKRKGAFFLYKEGVKIVSMIAEHFPNSHTYRMVAQSTKSVCESHTPMHEKAALLPTRSRVLISGLGIGWDIMNLTVMPNIQEIVCVEIEQDVIDLTASSLDLSKTTIVHSGIKAYLESDPEPFDLIYHDCFPEHPEFFRAEVEELKALSEPLLKPGGEIMIWRLFPPMVL